MKAKIIESQESFKPVDVVLTCESQAELNFWRCVFDSSIIEGVAKSLGCDCGQWALPCGSVILKNAQSDLVKFHRILKKKCN